MDKVKGIMAKQARYKARYKARYNFDNADASVEDILKSVDEDIRTMAASGSFTLTERFSAKSLSVDDLNLMVADLEKRGFVVQKESDENDHTLTLSWECE
ncbi:hypothetical protein MMG00_12680 [Ignatzschineria rhizosphaerae]|uniref:Phage protein n=1 Tax=Ignatzschineria rhizosphaerae TaxID=2923279 RepID=A0ABY3X2P6_9GAMM|nr:hypothetical protein [Ignatzschineria rhizosphaerae]UNM96036.1 hypothetical protein MMG00_12680 [Ignatzschineria rhizosphaerae]